MVGRASAHVAAVLCIIATAATFAWAQTLQRLTVQSFDLNVDTTAPRVDVPFHLILTLRVRARVSQIENINLPMLAQLELLGDERETTSGQRGTFYRETITVVAHDAGTLVVAPATLQAVDARDGKAKQWFTNSVTLRVGGSGSRAMENAGRAVLGGALGAFRSLIWLVLWVLGIGCVAAFGLLLFRRRRVAVTFAPGAMVAPVPERSRREQAEDALAVLRAERTRRAAIAVRGAIWAMVGALDGETLGDVLGRPESREMPMRDLLIALERSAFTHDEDLNAAVEDACCALERYIGSAQ